MKEGIGLAVFAMVSVFAIGMAVGKRIHTSMLVVLLLFGMASGWGIAQHDWLRHVQFQVPGFELFQARIAQIREDSLYEMKKSASAEREALSSLLEKSEEIQQRLATESKTADDLVETIRIVEENLKERERRINEMGDQTQTARDQMVAVQQAVSELSLALTRIVYLSLEAKDQYGQERSQMATRQIMDSLDELVSLSITDPQGRADFILGVTSSLPPRQGN